MMRLKELFVGRRRERVIGGYRLRYSTAPKVSAGEVLKSYSVGHVGVYLVREGAEVRYYVDEPVPTPEVVEFYPVVMDHIAYNVTPPETGDRAYLESYVANAVMEAVEQIGLEPILRTQGVEVLKYYIVRDVVGYGMIDPMMRDPNVEEVSELRPGDPVKIIHREVPDQLWIPTNVVIGDEAEMTEFVQRLAQKCGRYVSVAFPMIEAPTPERHRLAAHIGEIGTPSFTIRKFPEEPYTVTRLISFGTLTPLMAAYLWLVMESQGFVFVIGVQGSGKTTLLNSILSLVPPDWRVTTIEDTPELRLPHPNWDFLYTRKGYTIGSKLDIRLNDLGIYALRRRGQVIAIGEVRGSEVQALVQAAATGHGAACTFHATSIEETVVRLRSPPMNVGPGFIALIWNVVLMRRVKLPGGKVGRRMTRVWEVMGVKGEDVEYREVFTWDPRNDEFSPTTARTVVDKSLIMRRVAEYHGMTKTEVRRELERRSEFLEELVRKEVFGWREFYERVREFYATVRG